MRYHDPFTVFPRKMPSGLTVYYYRAFDETRPGHRTSPKSTGQSSKGAAKAYCRLLEGQGRLLCPDLPTEPTPGEITFGTWAKDFWSWDGPYIQTRLRFSDPDRPAISKRYADDMLRATELHIMPSWKRTRLNTITPQDIEAWALRLRDGGLSGKRVNNVVICLRTMLKEAHRAGLLTFDIGQKGIVRSLGNDTHRRGRLTLEEVRALFAEEAIETAWTGHRMYRAISMVGAATGMRQGEIMAVRDPDIRQGYIHVAHSWHPRFGLGPTKTKNERDVPLPPKVLAAVVPFMGSGGYVFSTDSGERPCSGNRATKVFYEALEKIGVTDRVERNITFHSWRHWLNTTLRAAGVPDDLTRRVTGHETAEMTASYTDYLVEDFAPVAKVQAEVFG